MSMKPKARRDELVIEELPEETLVYDLNRHKAYCLNQTTAVIWSHCDGQTDIKQLSRVLQKKLNLPADEDLIGLALERLERAHLLSTPMKEETERPRKSRRELMQRLGWIGGMAALLPAVITITAPTAQAAASCVTASDCKNFNRTNVGRCCCSPNKICTATKKCDGIAC